MSWRNAEKIEFLGGRRNNSGLQQERETHTVNKINDICDFSRGGLNTRLYMLVSKPCSEATNIVYFIYCMLFLAVGAKAEFSEFLFAAGNFFLRRKEFGDSLEGCDFIIVLYLCDF